MGDDNFWATIIVALITSGIPALVTIITSHRQSNSSKEMQKALEKQAERHSAKQSILQMIIEDEFYYEMSGKFPINYERILDEYQVYHQNGGNGEVTKKVAEYKEWYNHKEQELIKKEGK